MADIIVKTKEGSYSIIIGKKLGTKLVSQVGRLTGKNRVFVLMDSNVFALYGKKIEQTLSGAKFRFITLVVPAGEKSKSHTELNKIYDFLMSEKISRTDFVLAIGGGVLTDLAGFASATIMRGVKWGVISTTLLGMVDAAIGGKTGINHKSGKNLIGAFWQPSFVICDLEYLNTLPEREMLAGLGEILKYAGLTGESMINQLIEFLDKGNLLNFKKLEPLVRLGAAYKAKIVKADERESNKRMVLNLGHTFAHAIEKTLGYGKLLHGEAVIIGLNAAVILSKSRKRDSIKSLHKYESLLKTFLGFVRYYPIKAKEIIEHMKLDKKRSGVTQKFVLLERPGKPFIASGLKTNVIESAVEQALSNYKLQGRRRG